MLSMLKFIGRVARPLVILPLLASVQVMANTALVVVDPGVPNLDATIAEVSGKNQSTKVVVLHPNQNPLDQISQALAGGTSVESLHIISHAYAGELSLSNRMVDEAFLEEHSISLSQIDAALVDGAPVYFYGCELAKGAKGKSFVESFAEKTTTRVSASENLTGASAKGADWVLEYASASMPESQLFSTQFKTEYQGVLQNAPDITNLDSDELIYLSAFGERIDINVDAFVSDTDTGGNPETDLNNSRLRVTTDFLDGQYESFSVKTVGDGLGEVRRTDFEVFYEGVKIGDIDAFEDGVGRALEINFTTASVSAVQAVVRNITYQNTFVLRAEGERNVYLTLEDNDSESSNYSTVVDVQAHPAKPADSAPVEVNNVIAISNGETRILSNSDIYFADADNTSAEISFTASGISNGQFEEVANAGVAITSFTQEQITNGDIQFVHAGNNTAPTFSLEANDGTNTTGLSAASISFVGTVSDTFNVYENTLGVATITSANVVGTPSYALTGAAVDNASFSIDAATGELVFDSAADFETPGSAAVSNTYDVEVTVTGSTSGTDVRTISVNVLDVNEAPSISGTSPVTVLDPTVSDSYTFTPMAADPEGLALTFSIINLPSWASFNSSTGELSGTPDAEDAASYNNIQIIASDGVNSMGLEPFTINVLDADGNFTLDSCYQDNFLNVSAASMDDSWTNIASTGYNPQPESVMGEAHLRLTDTGDNRVGGVSKNFPIPSSGVTQIEFNAFAFGGSGADGISIILSDWNVAPDLGSPGGSLGYANATGVDGFAGAWLGIGIDEFGFFSNNNEGRNGGVGQVANAVAIRGSGSGQTGYKYLTGTASLTPEINNNSTGHAYRIIVDSSDGEHAYITIERDTGTGFVTLIDAFDALADADQAELPELFRLSFAASSGAQTNNHDLSELRVNGSECDSVLALRVTATPAVFNMAAGTATFTVQLNQPAPEDGVTVDYTTLDGTATSATEYDATAGSLSFAQGEQFKEVVVNLKTLTAEDVGKEFYFELSNAVGAFIGEATARALIPALNVAPVANDQTVNATEDTAEGITLTATDTESDPLSYSVIDSPSNGALSGTAPNLTYTPNANFNGSDSFTFQVNDGQLDSNIATVTINVSDENDDPVANAQMLNTNEDSPLAVTLSGSDIDGTIAGYTVGAAANGIISGVAPNITYTPNANYFGADSFTFTVTDDDGAVSGSATIAIVVNDVNDNPVAQAQALNTVEDVAIMFTLSGSDIDGSIAGYTVTPPINGVLSGTAPNLTYTPNNNFNGVEDISFTVTDDDGAESSAALVSISVGAANDLPVADAQALSVIENNALNITLTGSDSDGTITSYTLSDPSNGVISGTAPNITYTPNAEFFGSDSFTFYVTDDSGANSAAATISITVNEDTDGDLIINSIDADDDGDGLLDAIDGADDADTDTLANDRDTDSDNDGILDNVEAQSDADFIAATGNDTDGDGVDDAYDPDNGGTTLMPVDTDTDGTPDYLDSDTDDDTLSDLIEGDGDADSDGIPNYRDTDSDNDSIPDEDESDNDTDGDGTPDFLDEDSDNDGIPDSVEGNNDTDGDGTPDYIDLDSDNDGINDEDEGTGDSDMDSIPDYLDSSNDEDNDGVPDILEGTDDVDNDGTPNYLDGDSDNDGLPDGFEAQISENDEDNDGIDDIFDVDVTGGTDENGDGIDDDVSLIDSDGDGNADAFDTDSDNDGYPDALDGADALVGQDTDGDGVLDYLDTDSDNDGIGDVIETDATGIDTDGDGIDDAYDVDSTGGNDADNNGVDDDIIAVDTDNDGVQDYRDLDTDNDGLFDVIEVGLDDADNNAISDPGNPIITENPRDTDNDGIPDFRDLDSNDDGRFDIEDTPAHILDGDNDGRIDITEDRDGDGIDDSFDQQPDQFGSQGDNDGDGVPNSLDGDQDGDGIPDSIEGNGDFDGDGVVNFLDRDSDNDGLPDSLETDRPTPLGSDADLDGIDDSIDVDATGGVDNNNDGVDDEFVVPDTDGDGSPDFLDTDSDDDTLGDRLEQILVELVGTDNDADGFDDAVDVDATGGIDANNDGVDDAVTKEFDFDSDGVANYRDLDTDGDGYQDLLENDDYNSDGILDSERVNQGVITGVDGGASMSFYSVLVLFLLAIARISARGRTALFMALVLAASSAFSKESTAAEDEPELTTCDLLSSWKNSACMYVGAGLGFGRVKPDSIDGTWYTEDKYSPGYNLFAGLRLSDHIFTEFAHFNLGDANLKNVNPNINGRPDVSYTVTGFSGGYWLFDYGTPLNFYAKGGVHFLDTGGTSVADQDHSAQWTVGAGVEQQLKSRWFARAAVDLFDEDARMLSLSIGRYIGEQKPRYKPTPVPTPEPTPEPTPTPTPTPEPEPVELDSDNDGVLDKDDLCPGTPEGVSVDTEGCKVLETITLHIKFDSGSAEVSNEYIAEIERVAERLAEYGDDVTIKVEGHTDSMGSQQINQPLSEKRANAVADILKAQSNLDGIIFFTKGYGEDKPIASNDTVEGRYENRRVVIHVSPKS